MADMDSINAIAARHGVPVIEDACQAHGAEFRGRRAGSLGVSGCFSFYPGKNLGGYGEGGAVVTNDDKIATRLKSLRDHAQAQRYHHDEIGFNYRMDAFQGAVLGVKLRYVDRWTEARSFFADRYGKLLDGLPLQIPVEGVGRRSALRPRDADVRTPREIGA